MQTFVGSHHGLKPAVCHFVHRYADQAAQRTFPSNKSEHGVLHASVTALDHVVFGVHVGTDVVVDEGHGSCSVFGKSRPVAVDVRIRLVNETQRHTVHIHGFFDEIGVRGPSEVDDVGGFVAV